jgi:hypothetical protein
MVMGNVPASQAARFAGLAQPDLDRLNPLVQKHLESPACLRTGFRTIKIGVSLNLRFIGPLKRPLTVPPRQPTIGKIVDESGTPTHPAIPWE